MSTRGKYRSYTVKFKLEVAKYATNNTKLAASKKFEVHRILVQIWCKQENDLLVTSSAQQQLSGGGMNAKYCNIDKQLY